MYLDFDPLLWPPGSLYPKTFFSKSWVIMPFEKSRSFRLKAFTQLRWDKKFCSYFCTLLTNLVFICLKFFRFKRTFRVLKFWNCLHIWYLQLCFRNISFWYMIFSFLFNYRIKIILFSSCRFKIYFLYLCDPFPLL